MNIGETIRVFRAEPVLSPVPGDPPDAPMDEVRIPAPVEHEPSSPAPARQGG